LQVASSIVVCIVDSGIVGSIAVGIVVDVVVKNVIIVIIIIIVIAVRSKGMMLNRTIGYYTIEVEVRVIGITWYVEVRVSINMIVG